MKIAFEVNGRRVLMPALAGFIGVFVLHAAYPSLYTFWPSNSSELAAWVQAVGSIAAIAGAVWVADLQHRRQKERDEQNLAEIRKRRNEGFLALLKHAAGIVEKIVLAASVNGVLQRQPAIFLLVEVSGVHTRFAQLDAREFSGDIKLVDALSVAVAATQILVLELDGFIKAGEFGFESQIALCAIANAARNHLLEQAEIVARDFVVGVRTQG